MNKTDLKNIFQSVAHRFKSFLSGIDFTSDRSRIILASVSVVLIIALMFAMAPKSPFKDNDSEDAVAVLPTTPSPSPDATPTAEPEPEPTVDPATLPVIDMTNNRTPIKTSMLRINGPAPWGREIVYSAGNAATIDEPVLIDLFMYNLDTEEENKVASTGIKFGEIYEARANDDYVVWLDTDQRGTNIIYALIRKTGEVMQIKKSNYTHPQLRLFGDNLVWVEQIEMNEDRLYLYNFKSGEPVAIESFESPSYGTCPPSVYNDILVWAYPNEKDPTKSVIKKLDLKKALTITNQGGVPGQSTGADSGSNTGSDDLGSNGTGTGTDDNDPDKIDIEVIPSSSPDAGEDNPADVTPTEDPAGQTSSPDEEDGSIDPVIIDPDDFAIYPATNGTAIAWLDNLNPSKAALKLTLDDGATIKEVARGVGRIFGIGDTFIAYMQNDSIKLYFWESGRYANLTAEGEAGRLSDTCVSGNTVVWYQADEPNQAQDKVMVSVIDISAVNN